MVFVITGSNGYFMEQHDHWIVGYCTTRGLAVSFIQKLQGLAREGQIDVLRKLDPKYTSHGEGVQYDFEEAELLEEHAQAHTHTCT